MEAATITAKILVNVTYKIKKVIPCARKMALFPRPTPPANFFWFYMAIRLPKWTSEQRTNLEHRGVFQHVWKGKKSNLATSDVDRFQLTKERENIRQYFHH